MAGSIGKGKKIDRNRDKCRRYSDMGIREENKRRRLKRHLGKFPSDVTAINAYRKLGGKLS